MLNNIAHFSGIGDEKNTYFFHLWVNLWIELTGTVIWKGVFLLPREVLYLPKDVTLKYPLTYIVSVADYVISYRFYSIYKRYQERALAYYEFQYQHNFKILPSWFNFRTDLINFSTRPRNMLFSQLSERPYLYMKTSWIAAHYWQLSRWSFIIHIINPGCFLQVLLIHGSKRFQAGSVYSPLRTFCWHGKPDYSRGFACLKVFLTLGAILPQK